MFDVEQFGEPRTHAPHRSGAEPGDTQTLHTSRVECLTRTGVR